MQCRLGEQLVRTLVLVSYSALYTWFPVRKAFHLSTERTGDTAKALRRGTFCEDHVQEGPQLGGKAPGELMSLKGDLARAGLSPRAGHGTGQAECNCSRQGRFGWSCKAERPLLPFLCSFPPLGTQTELHLPLPNTQPRTQTSAKGYPTAEVLNSLPSPPTRLKTEEGLHLSRVGAKRILNSYNEGRHFERSWAPGLCVTITSGLARGQMTLHHPPPSQKCGHSWA